MSDEKWIALMLFTIALGCFWAAYILPSTFLGILFSIIFTLVGLSTLITSWLIASNGIRGG